MTQNIYLCTLVAFEEGSVLWESGAGTSIGISKLDFFKWSYLISALVFFSDRSDLVKLFGCRRDSFFFTTLKQ